MNMPEVGERYPLWDWLAYSPGSGTIRALGNLPVAPFSGEIRSSR